MPMNKSKVNAWTIVYWLMTKFLNIAMLTTPIVIAIKTDLFATDLFTTIFQDIKFFFAAISLIAHWLILPIIRFGDPNGWYFCGILKYTRMWIAHHDQVYINLVKICSICLLLFTLIQLIYIGYLMLIIKYGIPFSSIIWQRSSIYTKIAMTAELIQLFCILWMLAYRIIKESNYFYDYYDWKVWLRPIMYLSEPNSIKSTTDNTFSPSSITSKSITPHSINLSIQGNHASYATKTKPKKRSSILNTDNYYKSQHFQLVSPQNSSSKSVSRQNSNSAFISQQNTDSPSLVARNSPSFVGIQRSNSPKKAVRIPIIRETSDLDLSHAEHEDESQKEFEKKIIATYRPPSCPCCCCVCTAECHHCSYVCCIVRGLRSFLLFLFRFIPFIFVNVFVWVLVIVVFIVVQLLRCMMSIFCCCCGGSRPITLNKKRYGSWFDYCMFHVVFGLFHIDYVLRPLLYVEPFKFIITHLAMVFFQQRYINFVKCSLPNYSLKHDYITYDVLYDGGRTTYNRLLPSADDEYINKLPDIRRVANLYKRTDFIEEKNCNLSILLGFYVRWFTHQFANTSSKDPTAVAEPIGINLSQLYGSVPKTEKILRSFQNGLLKSSIVDGEEFPLIIDPDPHDDDPSVYFMSPNNIQSKFNAQHFHDPGFFAIHTIFFRHHQYIARSLASEYPQMSDEQIFQTAKLCNILTNLKLTIGLYTELGIVQTNLSAKFDISDLENLHNTWIARIFEPKTLYPSNSSTVYIEFNFLYRWHQMIPPEIVLPPMIYAGNNKLDERKDDEWAGECTLKLPYRDAVGLLVGKGKLERFILSLSGTKIGKVSLGNTDMFLCQTAILGTVRKSRQYKLQSFNDYREHLGFERYKSFEELNDDEEDQKFMEEVKDLYNNDIDAVEFYVGIFAERKVGKALHGPFLTAVFASFVFSLLVSTKLLRKDWKKMLTPLGRQIVNDMSSTKELIALHTDLNVNNVKFRVNHKTCCC